jgi:hypothetical protein
MGRPTRRASGGAPAVDPPEPWAPADDDPLWIELAAACGKRFGPLHKEVIREAVDEYRYQDRIERNTGSLAKKIEFARKINLCLHRARDSCTPRGSRADAGLIIELLAQLEGRTRLLLREPPSQRPGEMLGAMTLISDEIVRDLEAERANAPAQTHAWDHFAAYLAELVGAFLAKPQKLTSPRVVALVTALHRAVDLGRHLGDEDSAKKMLADSQRRLNAEENS